MGSEQRHLVVYDYGQGGIWAYVLGPQSEIVEKYPELAIVEKAPEWMTKEYLEKLESRIEAIDHPGILLTGVIAERARPGYHA